MTRTRRSIMWPVIVILIGGTWLLITAGAFPTAVEDNIIRAWPALLILFGFDVLLGRRQITLARRRVSLNVLGVIALLIAVPLVVWFAYARQADELKDDNRVVFSEAVPDEIESISIDIAVDRTAVTVQRAEPSPDDASDSDPTAPPRQLQAEFAGSNNSQVDMIWDVQGAAALLAVGETQRDSIPKLEDHGRGSLVITVPADVAINVMQVAVEEGDLDVNLMALSLERLDLTTRSGNLDVVLPDQWTDGSLYARGGSVTVSVPPGVALWMIPSETSGRPNYDYRSTRYFVLENGTLRPENIEGFPELRLSLSVGGNTLVTLNQRES